ncbi:MAG: DUF2802 domain-containing protein [Candidatus Abyssobacteria bacterium SURF_17]|jgi:hypothetical protein|uniref:DUF2802 domain-containing protein n=1 Tax=Candidatus Abyssobacteria bacterium SURF_17 TaxID=2093361 RepID=A0A419EXT9_9BACT|nr:MAG: DUF2802 domain-containing protein [Candidatus Abyssubacteria bacterium SURF_17]
MLEILFMAAGAALLALAAWLGKRQEMERIRSEPRQIVSGISPQGAAKFQASLTQLLHELHTLSRDVTLDLEQKLSELKELLQQADTKLEELGATERVKEKGNGAEQAKELEADSAEADLHETEEEGIALSSPTNRYHQIYQLADEGLPVDEIARRMQMGTGEIQLILSLRKED